MPGGDPCAGSGDLSAVAGEGGDDRLRNVPRVHEQGAGYLADLEPLRGQYALAVAPGAELVRAEARADGRAKPPRVAAVVPPGGQPFAQPVVVERGPGHHPFGDLPPALAHQGHVAGALNAVP